MQPRFPPPYGFVPPPGVVPGQQHHLPPHPQQQYPGNNGPVPGYQLPPRGAVPMMIPPPAAGMPFMHPPNSGMVPPMMSMPQPRMMMMPPPGYHPNQPHHMSSMIQQPMMPSLNHMPIVGGPPRLAIGGSTVITAAPTTVYSAAATTANSKINANNVITTMGINAFNNGNATAVFVNPTSNLLNKSIFTNPNAGMPLMLYIGSLPLDISEALITKILESCGKVSKFLRPTDPTSQIPVSFALVTYAQAICALRCYKILNGFEINAEEGLKLSVKLGSKETGTLEAVMETEIEAAKTLPEEMSLEDIYGPIRNAVQHLIQLENSANAVLSGGIATEEGDPNSINNESEEITEADGTIKTITTSEQKESAVGGAIATPASYYVTYLTEEDAVDEAGEKMLLTEIEKFRIRQLARDKEVEIQKKLKIKAKIQELRENQKKKAESEANSFVDMMAKESTSTNNANNSNSSMVNSSSNNGQLRPSTAGEASTIEESSASSNNNYKRRVENNESAEEIEAKRRRKLKVLQMLSNDLTEDELRTLEDSKSAPAPVAPPTIKLGLKGTGNKASSKTTGLGTALEDEEIQQHKREVVKLEYSAEELQEINMAYSNNMMISRNDDDDLDDSFAALRNKKLKENPATSGAATSIDISNIQAKVLAQAQAISAAIAMKSAASKTTTSGSAAINAQEKMKLLVDQIPTERDELFAYPVNWKLLDEQDMINTVILQWVSKKIVEYLGVEEPMLTEFIVSKLKSHCQASEILDELEVVLDEDAITFVLKLWRMLVYYSIKTQ